jgi:hypothetical protein
MGDASQTAEMKELYRHPQSPGNFRGVRLAAGTIPPGLGDVPP